MGEKVKRSEVRRKERRSGGKEGKNKVKRERDILEKGENGEGGEKKLG